MARYFSTLSTFQRALINTSHVAQDGKKRSIALTIDTEDSWSKIARSLVDYVEVMAVFSEIQ